jgi:hypothetical protein
MEILPEGEEEEVLNLNPPMILVKKSKMNY